MRDKLYYCPICGNPAWKTKQVSKDDTTGEDRGYNNKFFGLDMITTEPDDDNVYIGIIIGEADIDNDQGMRYSVNQSAIIGRSIDACREIVKIKLENVGLWKECSYGLWTILRIS